jgi:hypothetical protein
MPEKRAQLHVRTVVCLFVPGPPSTSGPGGGSGLSFSLGDGGFWTGSGPDAVGEYPMLRNSAPGPEIGLPGRMSAGFLTGKHQHRHSGRPKSGRRADFDALPI